MNRIRISRFRWRLGSIVVGVTMLVGTQTSGVSLGAVSGPAATFAVFMNGCWYATGQPNAQVSVTWKNAAGHVKAAFATTTDGGGEFQPSTAVCSAKRIRAQDRIKVVFSGSRRTFTVPDVSLAYDRSSDSATGHAPASSHVELTVWHNQFAAVGMPDPACTTQATANSNNVYVRNMRNLPDDDSSCTGTFNPSGGDGAAAVWRSTTNDEVRHLITLPYLQVALGKSSAIGAATSGQSLTVHLRAASGKVRATAKGTAAWDGAFSLTFRSASGTAVKARPGDHVDGNWAGVSSTFAVPGLFVTWDAGDNSVRGRCNANTAYLLQLGYGGSSVSQPGTTDSAGYTNTLHPTDHTVTHGDTLKLWCGRSSGDRFLKAVVL